MRVNHWEKEHMQIWRLPSLMVHHANTWVQHLEPWPVANIIEIVMWKRVPGGWPCGSTALSWEQHPSQDSEMTARTTTVGTAVTQQSLTGSCQPFTTAVSPSYRLCTAIFHPSPTSSTWTAGASIGRTGGRHSVYTCHCQREGKTCLGLEQGQPLRPALKPK